jgi:PAS domain S-box-containing protein
LSSVLAEPATPEERDIPSDQPEPPPFDTGMGQVPMDRLRLVFDGMFDGVWLVAPDGRTTYANRAMAGLLGSTQEAMRRRPIADYLDEPFRSAVDGFLGRQEDSAGERIEVRFRRANGSELHALLAGSPIVTADGVFAGTMLNISDVTAKRNLDAHLVQAQRLEAIGLFASGVAHDFNNLLTAIRGYAELARLALPEGDPVRSDMDEVLAAADRAVAVTHKLLAFSGRQVLAEVLVEPADLIAGLLPILRPMLGDDIRIELRLAADRGFVRADPRQLEQVIVNLAVNAHDAMPVGGTLTIALGDTLVPGSDAETPGATGPGPGSVRITVSDTGIGMDAATMAHCFEPFFTTKDPSQGTGLGLATAHGIVTQSGGRIGVESTPGVGTSFLLDFPRVDGVVEPPAPPAATTVDHREGVILLVDDEPAVREVGRRALAAAGYTVIACGGGEEALVQLGQFDGKVDVLVTDIVMPGIHGPELARRVRASHPGLGVVFTSGFAADGPKTRGAVLAGAIFLPKPFTIVAVVEAVGDAMRATHRAGEDGAGEPTVSTGAP